MDLEIERERITHAINEINLAIVTELNRIETKDRDRRTRVREQINYQGGQL